MWDKGKLLLAAFLFITLSCKVSIISKTNTHSILFCQKKIFSLESIFEFCTQLKGTTEELKLLDMAPDAVDVTYTGCREQAMEEFINSGLLEQELNHTKEFKEEWSENANCGKLIPGGVKEHTTALRAFVNGFESGQIRSDYIRIFDGAVATTGANISTYTDNFHFKPLYFLLMDAITLLNPKKCKTLFYISEKNSGANKGSEVRFGKFIIGNPNYIQYLKESDLDEFVLFNITSCFYANLGDNICHWEDIALLSSTEVFTVEEVKKITDKNGATYTNIALNHSRLVNKPGCKGFSR